MAGSFTSIDLSQLPAPDVIETIDFDNIVADMLTDLIARDGTFSALVESDPAYKILEVAAYREVLLRQRVNEACYAVMLAFAQKGDLDQVGANLDVARLTITPADDTTVPPTAAVMEEDGAYRARIQLSFEGYTTAGSTGSYVFAALSASGAVKDADAVSPAPGQVTVYVLSNTGDGTADQPLIDTVAAALSAQTVRPLTDQVTVQSASVVPYTIAAELEIYEGPDASTIQAAALAAVQDYVSSIQKIGYDVAVSGIYKALHQSGVKQVNLTAPTANIVMGDGQAAYCDPAAGITITTVGAGSA